MNKNLKILFYIILVSLFISLTGCDEKIDPVDKEIEIHSVFFFKDDILLKIEEVKDGEDATAPLYPTKKGYNFIGWDIDYKNVKNDLVVKAKYTPKENKVRYINGEENFSNTYKFDEPLICYIPKKTGFEFNGWYLDLNDETPYLEIGKTVLMSDEEITLYAKWEPIIYEVIYFTNGADLIANDNLKYGEDLILPKITKPFHVFVGWYLDYELTIPITEGKMKDNNINLYAKWKKESFKVILDENGGDPLDDLEFLYGNISISELPVPTNSHGEFLGWYYYGEPIQFPFIAYLTQNITFVAQWKHVEPNFQEFENFIYGMDNLILNTNSYSLYMFKNITASFDEYEVKDERNILITKDNFYREDQIIKNGLINNYEIYKIDGELVYLLKVSNNQGFYNVDTDYLYKTSELTYKDLEFSKIFNKYMNYLKIDDNHYQITYVYNNNTNDEYKALFDVLGMQDYEIYYSSPTITFDILYDTVKEEYIITVMSDRFRTIKNGQVNYTTLNFIFKYKNFNNIERFDLNNENIRYLQPDSIDTVKEITDITLPIISYQVPYPHFYKVSFETGQYIISSENINSSNITIYDINGNIVDLGPLWKSYSTFVITEGMYYLSIKNGKISAYNLEFIKLEYESTLDYNNPNLLEEVNLVTLEGEHDFVVYKYVSDKKRALNITSDNIFKVYYKDVSGNLSLIYVNSNNTYIPIIEGENLIYINSNEPINLSFNVQEIEYTISPNDTTQMIYLTDEYNQDYYVFGFHKNEIYLRIDVTNPGTYTLEYETQNTTFINRICFYKLNGDSSNSTSAYLMEGTYYVKVSSNIGHLAKIKIKYTYTEGFDNEFSGITNLVENYEVMNIYLEKGEVYTIPVLDIFKNSNIDIYLFMLQSNNLNIATVLNNEVSISGNGTTYISVMLFEAFSRTRYITRIANVYATDSSTMTEIKTVQDLININNNLNGNYILKADINLKGINWNPIGDYIGGFKGIFINPDGFIISNLECKDIPFAGLFGRTENAFISGVILKSIKIKTDYGTNHFTNAGGITYSSNNSMIYNCKVEGDIISTTYGGGIVGINNWGQIVNCEFEGTITVSGENYSQAGGIVADNATMDNYQGISGCRVNATITSDCYAGGIIGEGIYYGGTSNNHFEGTLIGPYTNELGNE